MADSLGFDDMTSDDFAAILYDLVNGMSTNELFAIGDIESILAEELNNEVLTRWANDNDRCEECGMPLDDGECPVCD